jgi:hypothetical protein
MNQEQLGLASGLLVVILTALWPMLSSMMPAKAPAREEQAAQTETAGETKPNGPDAHSSTAEPGVPAISTSIGKTRKSSTVVANTHEPHSGPDLGGPN